MCALDIHTVSLFVLRILSVKGFRADYCNIRRRANANLHNFIIRSICLLEFFAPTFCVCLIGKFCFCSEQKKVKIVLYFIEAYASILLKFGGDFAFVEKLSLNIIQVVNDFK